MNPLRRLAIGVTAALLIVGAADRASAVTHLRRGEPAAPIKLTDLDGATFDLAAQRDAAVVLIFGELYHDNTVAACRRVGAMLGDVRLQGQTVRAVLIVAHDDPPAKLKQAANERGVSLRIVHDPKRAAFGAYRVAVMPSVVVIDERGRIVYAIAGLTARFDDIVTDAMLLATGLLSAEQFEKQLHPDRDEQLDETTLRAMRTTHLADQLAERGLIDLALEKYGAALEIKPDHAPAHLGMGLLLLDRRRLPEAERAFRAVLAVDAASIDAQLGLAYVQMLRGGDELIEAERRVLDLLVDHPSHARAYYLLGRIYEQRQSLEQATASYKKAAELLMKSAQNKE